MKFTSLLLVLLLAVSAVLGFPDPHKKKKIGFGGGKKFGGFGGGIIHRPIHVIPVPVFHGGGYGKGFGGGGFGGGGFGGGGFGRGGFGGGGFGGGGFGGGGYGGYGR